MQPLAHDNVYSSLEITPCTSFDMLNLKSDLLRGISGKILYPPFIFLIDVLGYSLLIPLPIQSKTISVVLKRNNFLIQGGYATGKSTALIIAVLQMINPKVLDCQVVIMTPDLERVNLITKTMLYLGKFMDISIHALTVEDVLFYEGQDSKGAQIIIGSLEQVAECINYRLISLDNIRLFAFDHVERIIDDEYLDIVNHILKVIPAQTKIGMLSSAMPIELLEVISQFMEDYTEVFVRNNEMNMCGVRQYYLACMNTESKFDTLVDIFDSIGKRSCHIALL